MKGKNDKPQVRTPRLGIGCIALLVKLGPKLFAVLGKAGSVLIKLLKGVKVGKAGLAAASFGSYAYLFTWEFALIIMVLLFVHESGHVWAMRRSGLKTKGIYFIPFIGAAAVADEMFPSRRSESYIAIMGPVWGLGLTIVSFVVYLMTKNPFFAAAAAWMGLINVFNLLPINPLDGGRIFKSVMFSINTYAGIVFLWVGIIVTLFVTIQLKLFLFFLLLFVGGIELVYELYIKNRMKGDLERDLNEMREMRQLLLDDDPEFITKLRRQMSRRSEKDELETLIMLVIALEKKKPGQTIVDDKTKEDMLKSMDAFVEQRGEQMRALEKPAMSAQEIALYVFLYFIVCGALLAVMLLSQGAPGAKEAMDVLR